MDSIFAIVALIVFYLLQGLASRKQKKPPQPHPPHDTAEGQDPELSDALEEIRQALGMGSPAQPESAPQPSARPQPLKASGRKQVGGSRLEGSRPRTEGPRLPQGHRQPEGPRLKSRSSGPGDRLPGLEDRFEMGGPEFMDPLADLARIPGLDDVPTGPGQTKPTDTGRFSSPEALRDAVVAYELLGPPLALRRRKPGR